jgi:hypothetical protein
LEAKEEKRERYLEEIKEIPREKIVYFDEAGIDMNICKDRGWAKKGEILQGKKSGKHYERTNIIAGYVDRKPIAPMCLVPNNCGIIFEDTKEERESLWDRYCMQMPEQRRQFVERSLIVKRA